MVIPDILTKPLYRPRSTYQYKVIQIKGNEVTIDALDGSTPKIVFSKEDPLEFEQYYQSKLDNLYITINMDSKVGLIIKESPTTKWKHIK